MKKENCNSKYHIDVTPEEDLLYRDLVQTENKKKPKYAFVLTAVIAAHALIGVGLFSHTISAQANEMPKKFAVEEDKKFLEKQNDLSSTETTENKPLFLTKNSSSTKVQNFANKSTQQITKFYIVKKGDTIYSIAQKYKLNTKTLLEINNIKDPNKIEIGQKLRFVP